MRDPATMKATERVAEIAQILARACSRLRACGSDSSHSHVADADADDSRAAAKNSQNDLDAPGKLEPSCERAENAARNQEVA